MNITIYLFTIYKLYKTTNVRHRHFNTGPASEAAPASGPTFVTQSRARVSWPASLSILSRTCPMPNLSRGSLASSAVQRECQTQRQIVIKWTTECRCRCQIDLKRKIISIRRHIVTVSSSRSRSPLRSFTAHAHRSSPQRPLLHFKCSLAPHLSA